MGSWYKRYAADALARNKLGTESDQLDLLLAGLVGEAGSIAAEVKKRRRDHATYRETLREEIGDCLWYLTVFTEQTAPEAVRLEASEQFGRAGVLDLAAAVGDLVHSHLSGGDLSAAVAVVWEALQGVCMSSGIQLSDVAARNVNKTASRWPNGVPIHHPLFDVDCPEAERLPRRLSVQFSEAERDGHRVVALHRDGVQIGDYLTDNIQKPDDYAFHDVFHLAHAVFLGWSPVLRKLLGCKRKSLPDVDENEDGARAMILEEGVAALVFSRAKRFQLFEGVAALDYDLLKLIAELVDGYEVCEVPLWQWEQAIIEGYGVFRDLVRHRGGTVNLNLDDRTLRFRPGSGHS